MDYDYVYIRKTEDGSTIALTLNDMRKVAKEYRFYQTKDYIKQAYPEGKNDWDALTRETIFQMDMFNVDIAVALEDAIYIIEQEKKEKEAR